MVSVNPQVCPQKLRQRLAYVQCNYTLAVSKDQGIFVKREIFQELGGFKEIPLMEDLEFSRRLRKRVSVITIKSSIVTSARRFNNKGIIRTLILMQILKVMYRMGFSPRFLKRLYN